jgi:hypothetical protein
MKQTRFLIKDRDGKGSTTGWVVWAHNYLNQRRQFATDGVKFFYQKTKRDPFEEVSESSLPANAAEALRKARETT